MGWAGESTGTACDFQTGSYIMRGVRVCHGYANLAVHRWWSDVARTASHASRLPPRLSHPPNRCASCSAKNCPFTEKEQINSPETDVNHDPTHSGTLLLLYSIARSCIQTIMDIYEVSTPVFKRSDPELGKSSHDHSSLKAVSTSMMTLTTPNDLNINSNCQRGW